jgi:DNA methylase
MAIIEEVITDRYAAIHGDCMAYLSTLEAESVHLTLYSPPFQGLGYVYSSDERDLSNSLDDAEFWKHYDFIVRELHRVTMPGRLSVVHCMDLPTGNTGLDHCSDFPGDIIRQHERLGWSFLMRRHIWKEPLTIRNRTMVKALSHKALTQDSTKLTIAHADQLLFFRRSGENPVPVAHPHGLLEYAGDAKMPADILKYRNWQGSQLENRFSQWIWRRYASSIWDDVRLDRTLPHKPARDENDERHVHPLQLDVIERAVVLGSNPGEVVLTPFMGVGSEVFGAVINGRRGIGIELKQSYFRQAVQNLKAATSIGWKSTDRQEALFADEWEIMDGPEASTR